MSSLVTSYTTHTTLACVGQKKQLRKLYLTDVASRAATRTHAGFSAISRVFTKMLDSLFGSGSYGYLDDLLSEDFITLFLFC